MREGALFLKKSDTRLLCSLLTLNLLAFAASLLRSQVRLLSTIWPIMSSQEQESFNDFSGQPMSMDTSQPQPRNATSANEDDSNYVPRPKRMACIVCRKRKLKCDGKKPSCGTCARVGHNCAYDEVRKKSGPKRGYVKQLEARLGMLP